MLSRLQKYIVQELYTLRRATPQSFRAFYKRIPNPPKGTDQQTSIIRSLERLIDQGYIVGKGRKTKEKWFLYEVLLTGIGRHAAKKTFGSQQTLPFTKKKTNKTRMKKVVSIFIALALLMPFSVHADGMMVPPSEQWIEESGQQAVIMYENGVETLVLSTSFQGDAEDFGWIVPVPNKPEVSRGSQELFSNLQSATSIAPTYTKNTFGLGAVDEVTTSTVSVIDVTNVDYYEVTTLQAQNSADLVKWFTDNKYTYPSSASHVLHSYIDNGWYFVAMRINPENISWDPIQTSFRTGQATPVKLVFEAPHVVYPLKISSVTAPSVTTTTPTTPSLTPTYSTGQFGNSLKIDTSDVVSIGSTKLFPDNAGTIELWVSPDTTWQQSTGYWEFLTVTDSSGRDLFEFRRRKDFSSESLQFIAYPSTGSFQSWRTALDQKFQWTAGQWYHVAVTWSDDQQPVFYVNGVSYPSEPGYPTTKTWNVRSASDGMMYIGERKKGSFLRGYLDELRISSTPHSASTIQSTYENSAKVVAPAQEADTIALFHFNNSLLESVTGESVTLIKPAAQKKVSTITHISRVPITLYVIADTRLTTTGFTTRFANTITDKGIQNLATNETGDPLLTPNKKKYTLTVLYASMTPASMTDDVFFKNAGTSATIGTPIGSNDPSSSLAFYLTLAVSFIFTLLFGAGLLVINRKPEKRY